MPLIVNETKNEHIKFGVWEITEDLDFFLKNVNLTPNEQIMFRGLVTERRKIQWLCYRLLIKQLLNIQRVIDIVYDYNGKPRILDMDIQISVSHSGNYVAAIASDGPQIGIDIEKLQARIDRVLHKFLNEDEIQHLQDDNTIEHKTTCWCAKEALFKIFGQKQIDFKKNIHLDSFIYKPDMQFEGTVISSDMEMKTSLFVKELKNYILVYAVEKITNE